MMLKKFIIIFFVSSLLLSGSILQGWNIKIIPGSGLDATELKSLVRSITADCKSDQEKMVALWAFITRNPFYHWCEAREGREATNEYGLVYDPIKAFNVHGTVICYQVADLLSNMAQEAGIPARTRGFPYKHKVMEAFYDGAWHLFDAQYDCQAIYYKPDGKTIASLNEVDADPEGYLLKQAYPSDPFFQFEKFGGNIWPWETRRWVIDNWFNAFETEELGHSYPLDCQGHTINISLCRGEKLVRHWDNQGKWFCSPGLFQRWNRDLTQRWVALGPHDPRNPQNTYANGWLIYRPDWRASEDNFLDGLYQGENYRLEQARVHPAEPGRARVCFRVSSPYLLAGHPNRLSIDGDSEGGSIFKADFFRANSRARARIDVSTDNGITWRAVWQDTRIGRHPVELDLTNQVEGTYGYLLRVELEARNTEEVSFGGMELKNSLFYSPVLLPAMAEGENVFTVELSEPSRQLCLEPDFSSMESLKKYCFSIDNLEYGSHFTRRLSPPQGRSGSLVVEIDPPGDGLIHWMTVYGSFGIDLQAEEKDSLQILYAQKAPENWRVLWEASTAEIDKSWLISYEEEDRPPLAGHWRFDKSVEVHPVKPCKKCYIKYRVTRKVRASLNNLKVYAYYEPERPAGKPQPGDIVITHSWMEAGTFRSHSETPKAEKHSYVVTAGDTSIVNESITIEVKNKGVR